ncbi:MAG TPA: type II CAAX endopeptidase family protein [Clostridia bacterium]|nr:type II CAAX endopeptidase family protein [Clostridia bacterium]
MKPSENKNYDLLGVNVLFMLLGLVFLTFGAYIQSVNFDIGIFITEYFIVLLPVFLYGYYKKVDLKEALRLKPLKSKVLLKIIALSFFLVPIIGFGNIIVTTVLNFFDLVIVYDIPTAQGIGDFLKYTFLIAISAGICEEIFFRGMVLNAYEQHTNKRTAFFMSSILFGMFHYNIQNLVGPILLGFIFAYLVYITDSILSAIIAHAINNWVSVTAGFIVNNFGSGITEVAQNEASFSSTDLIMGTIMMGVIASISLLIILLFLKSIKNDCLVLADNQEILIDSDPYFVLRRKKNGIIVSRNDLDYLKMSAKELYGNLIFIKDDELKQMTIKSNEKILVSNNKVIDSYKIFPIGVSFAVYFFYTIVVWKSFGLI